MLIIGIMRSHMRSHVRYKLASLFSLTAVCYVIDVRNCSLSTTVVNNVMR